MCGAPFTISIRTSSLPPALPFILAMLASTPDEKELPQGHSQLGEGAGNLRTAPPEPCSVLWRCPACAC
eukprot:5331371-Pyramimonas_sp.AAC.1